MLVYVSYSRRHLGFHTLKMIRKNDNVIFLKDYDVFFQNQVSFCFYQKITNEPTLKCANLPFRSICKLKINHILVILPKQFSLGNIDIGLIYICTWQL